MKYFVSDGTRALPSNDFVPATVLFDNSVLSRVLNRRELAADREAQRFLKWLRTHQRDRLELILGPAIVESCFQTSQLELRHFYDVQKLKLNQLVQFDHAEGSTREAYLQSIARMLSDVVGYLICILEMRDIFSRCGDKLDDASAVLRIREFNAWAGKHSGLGGTTLMAAPMHEALGINTRAKKAFGLTATKADFGVLLNGAFDLYQLDVMLSGNSGFIETHPFSVVVWATGDSRLGDVLENFGVVDRSSGLVGLTPKTLGTRPLIAEAARGGIRHVPTFDDMDVLNVRLQQLAIAFRQIVEKVNDRKFSLLCGRLEEAALLLKGHKLNLLPTRYRKGPALAGPRTGPV